MSLAVPENGFDNRGCQTECEIVQEVYDDLKIGRGLWIARNVHLDKRANMADGSTVARIVGSLL